MAAGAWRPLFEGEAQARCLAVVDEIAAALPPPDGFDLSRGAAGQALFFAYLDVARPDRGHADRARDLLDRAAAALDGGEMRPSLYHGLAGLGWVNEHLRAMLYADDADDGNAEVDAVLADILGSHGGDESFDLISGLVGIGVYASERARRPSGRALLERVFASLERQAVRVGAGVAWRTLPGHMSSDDARAFPDGRWDLGVAHGVPGVIALLARMLELGLPARALLDGAVAWQLSHALAGADASFAAFAPPEGEATPTRTAWCYGDAGVAAALFDAARAADVPAWAERATAIALAAQARTETGQHAVDANLCHGLCGLGLVFQHLHRLSDDARLGDAARGFHVRGLGSRRDGEGIAGFKTATGYRGIWETVPGFLTGVSGVGLALLAAATDVAPGWARALALALPERAGARYLV